ncbi:MAG TPA: hypothetical protein VN858_00515 [Casimicrobiaceae bacterium]|nr:hypothetical protein [Casimicrobiaceae bacterium]
MYRTFTKTQLIATAALTLCASIALADDSSLSVLTGDSYAYFNQLDYRPGGFNVARALQLPGNDTAKAPQAKERDTAMKMPQSPRQADRPIMLADRPRISLPSPFNDDKGA